MNQSGAQHLRNSGTLFLCIFTVRVIFFFFDIESSIGTAIELSEAFQVSKLNKFL